MRVMMGWEKGVLLTLELMSVSKAGGVRATAVQDQGDVHGGASWWLFVLDSCVSLGAGAEFELHVSRENLAGVQKIPAYHH